MYTTTNDNLIQHTSATEYKHLQFTYTKKKNDNGINDFNISYSVQNNGSKKIILKRYFSKRNGKRREYSYFLKKNNRVINNQKKWIQL
jgi:hypothetical protein